LGVSRRLSRWIGVATCTAVLVALQLGSAQAQSCCGVVSEDELSVVAPYRRAVLSTRLSFKHMLGRHDSYGEYQPLSDDVSATDTMLGIGAGLRFPFYERVQLHGSLAGRLQHRRLPDFDGSGTESATRVGLGDASLFLRWSVSYDDQKGMFGDDASYTPWFDVFVGARAPLGTFDQGGSAVNLARTMGDGAWGVIGGARAIKYLTPSHALRLSLRYDARLVRDANLELTGASEFSPGDQVGVTFGYLGLRGMYWMYGATVDVTFTRPSETRAPGEPFVEQDGTEGYETTLGLHVTRVLLMPKLDLTASVVYTPPIPQLSQNISWEGIQGGVAVRYHWFP
jgi:hypothetical protein